MGHVLIRALFRPPGARACRVLVLLLLIACAPARAGTAVTLLLSEPGGIYQQAALALEQELALDEGTWTVHRQQVGDHPTLPTGADELIIPLGVRALAYTLQQPGNAPVFAVLVPSQTFGQQLADHPQASRQRPVSALFLDQPFLRQMQLIHLALPKAGRVGVLVGSATAGQADTLRKAGREAGLEVRVQQVENRQQLFAGLNELARDVDVLLLVPDPQVVGGPTLQALFQQTYQLRLPIVSYAAGLVQAGATLGLYATPTQLGAEAGQWLRGPGREKPGMKAVTLYPRRFTVEVNRNVARTLELPVPPAETLNTRLELEPRR